MSVYGRILLAAIGSAGLLLGAFGFQFIAGLAPCPMCLWQRWPHAAGIVIGILAMTVLWRWRRALAGLGAGAMVIGAGLGVFHAGVEQKWWDGPGTCTGADPTTLSTDDLLAQIMATPLVRCDEIVWQFMGLTMAGWNALISAGLAALWVCAALPRTPTRHIAPT